MFETKHSKINGLQRPSNTKQINRGQNIPFEIWKYDAVRKYKI